MFNMNSKPLLYKHENKHIYNLEMYSRQNCLRMGVSREKEILTKPSLILSISWKIHFFVSYRTISTYALQTSTFGINLLKPTEIWDRSFLETRKIAAVNWSKIEKPNMPLFGIFILGYNKRKHKRCQIGWTTKQQPWDEFSTACAKISSLRCTKL